MSSFCVILAEQISTTLQYMVANLKVYSSLPVFALLFKLLKLKLAYQNQKSHANYNRSCTKRVNSFVYFEIYDPCVLHKNSVL